MKDLKNLQSVSYQQLQRGLSVRDDFSPREHYHTFLKANAVTLKSLTLPLSFAVYAPPDVLRSLTHMDIWQDADEEFTQNSSAFLRHATNLSSLAVRARGLYGVLQALCNNASHLVGLTALKLLWTSLPEAQLATQDTINTHFSRIADFVRGNLMLRRLDLSAGSATPLRVIMPCIRALNHLEALALRLPAEYEADDLSFLAEHLPNTLTDLGLFSAMEPPEAKDITLSVLVGNPPLRYNLFV